MEISVLTRYVTFFNTQGTVEYKGNTIATIVFDAVLIVINFQNTVAKKKKKDNRNVNTIWKLQQWKIQLSRLKNNAWVYMVDHELLERLFSRIVSCHTAL